MELLNSFYFRAGNVATIPYFGTDNEKVIGGHKNAILYSSEITTSSKFIPVHLSEEWLIAFGFEKILNFIYPDGSIEDLYPIFKKGKYIIRLSEFDKNEPQHFWISIYNDFYTKHYMPLKELKFVHQLQNLYFELEDNELPRPKYPNRIK